MKKAISVIINILSIICAVIVAFLGAFCVYDWISISGTQYADTIEFWLVVDYYAVGMLAFSVAGAVLSLIYYKISPVEKFKTATKILIAVFAVVAVISVVLYFLPFEF